MDESVQKELAKVGTKKLKLSQAMRIGCLMHPQGFDSYYFKGRTCAYGAAAYGAGFNGTDNTRLRVFLSKYFGPGVFFDTTCALGKNIVTLNDSDGKSREEIADMLEACGL